MTDHYREAEKYARLAANYKGHPSPGHEQAARLAQVHAALAALPTPPAEASRAEVADLLEEADAVSMNVEDIYEHFAQWLTERCVITRREATDG